MRTISIINNKGGVGKTASVTTIAHMMATLYNKKVLVIDLDPQGNTSSRYSEVDFIQIFLSIMDKTPIQTELSIAHKGESFRIYVCTEGSFSVRYAEETISIQQGETILIPATLREYEFQGEAKILEVYI